MEISDFKKDYIKLLKWQVEQEIQFLEDNGHHEYLISSPCIFCFEHSLTKQFKCRRLTELKQFKASMLIQELKPKVNKRRPIGSEVKGTSEINSELLPLMSPL